MVVANVRRPKRGEEWRDKRPQHTATDEVEIISVWKDWRGVWRVYYRRYKHATMNLSAFLKRFERISGR